VRCLPDIGTELLFSLLSMPSFILRLVEDPLFSNFGAHGLEDDASARIAGIELARSVRQARPALVGQLFDLRDR
jgi:hypothetical protein